MVVPLVVGCAFCLGIAACTFEAGRLPQGMHRLQVAPGSGWKRYRRVHLLNRVAAGGRQTKHHVLVRGDFLW